MSSCTVRTLKGFLKFVFVMPVDAAEDLETTVLSPYAVVTRGATEAATDPITDLGLDTDGALDATTDSALATLDPGGKTLSTTEALSSS